MDPAHQEDVVQWQKKRDQRLRAEDSWLTLIGLHWLNEGFNDITLVPGENVRLVRSGTVVTLEPCAMCAGAIALARLSRLYFGAGDAKGGAVLHGPRLFGQPTCHHRPDILSGIGEEEAAAMLRGFFAERR